MVLFCHMAKVVVGKTSDIGEGKLIYTTAGGKEILIANVGGTYYAIGNICNHAGAELHEGELNGKELTCPWHGAKWDVSSGKLIWFPQKLRDLDKYNVIVENGTVCIEV
jgi:nitrite reductase/ring-hydroxylating ferredoxin subunit